LEAAPSRTADDERRLINLRGAKLDWGERVRRFEASLALFRGGGHGSGMTREWFAAYADELRFALSLASPVDRDVMATLAVRGWQSGGGVIPLAITIEECDAAKRDRQAWIAEAEAATGRPFGREGREPMVPVGLLSSSFIYGRVFPHGCAWLLTEVERRSGVERTLDWPALQGRIAALPDASPDVANVHQWVLVLADCALDHGILRRLPPRSYELIDDLLSR
jgi:hypothetical protein